MTISGTNRGSNCGIDFDAKSENSNNLWERNTTLTIGRIESTGEENRKLLAERAEGSRAKPTNQTPKLTTSTKLAHYSDYTTHNKNLFTIFTKVGEEPTIMIGRNKKLSESIYWLREIGAFPKQQSVPQWNSSKPLFDDDSFNAMLQTDSMHAYAEPIIFSKKL